MSRKTRSRVRLSLVAAFAGLAVIVLVLPDAQPPALRRDRLEVERRSSPRKSAAPESSARAQEEPARGAPSRAPAPVEESLPLDVDQEELFRVLRERAPARFSQAMSAVARDPATPVARLEGALGQAAALPRAEREAFLLQVALGLEARLAACEAAADVASAPEIMARRELGEAVRAALVSLLGPELRARLLDRELPRAERLLLAAAALEGGASHDEAVARALARDLPLEVGGELDDRRRVAVVATLPGESRETGLAALLAAPGLGEGAALAAAAELAARASSDVARSLVAAAQASPAARSRARLAYGAVLVLGRLVPDPETRETATGAVRVLEACVAGRDAEAARAALDVLAARPVAGCDEALERLAAAGAGELTEEVRALARRRG